jgi:hypothetical protein
MNRNWGRPSTGLLLFAALLLLVALLLAREHRQRQEVELARIAMARDIVLHLGLSDLALSNEARYTRHPVASDPVVVGMDHPGALDRFPSTLFWAPPR